MWIRFRSILFSGWMDLLISRERRESSVALRKLNIASNACVQAFEFKFNDWMDDWMIKDKSSLS